MRPAGGTSATWRAGLRPGWLRACRWSLAEEWGTGGGQGGDAYDQTDELRAIPAVGNHLREIAAIDENKIYVEAGFPSAATIPLFHQLYGDRLKIVQLVRHPILASASMTTHGWYSKTRADLREGVLLLPTDAGAFQKHYAQRWASLSRYEKCLFYWTEIHMYGIEMHWHYSNVPFLRVPGGVRLSLVQRG